MSDISLVTALHKTQSRFDFVHKGRTFQFEIEPCGEGIEASFVVDMRIRDVVPEHMHATLIKRQSLDDIVGRKAIINEHIELRWWEKLARKTLEQKVTRWASKTQQEYIKIEATAEKIRNIASL